MNLNRRKRDGAFLIITALGFTIMTGCGAVSVITSAEGSAETSGNGATSASGDGNAGGEGKTGNQGGNGLDLSGLKNAARDAVTCPNLASADAIA